MCVYMCVRAVCMCACVRACACPSRPKKKWPHISPQYIHKESNNVDSFSYKKCSETNCVQQTKQKWTTTLVCLHVLKWVNMSCCFFPSGSSMSKYLPKTTIFCWRQLSTCQLHSSCCKQCKIRHIDNPPWFQTSWEYCCKVQPQICKF